MLYKGTKEMNANELAEDLEGAKLVILKLNEMLRQQQAEIEALKTKAHEWYLIAMGKAQEK